MQRKKQGLRFEEVNYLIRESKLKQFIYPTKEKRLLFIALAMALGISYALIYVSGTQSNESLYVSSLLVFVALSFPSFLLYSGYGISATNYSAPSYMYAIALQSVWLYFVSCFFCELKKGNN